MTIFRCRVCGKDHESVRVDVPEVSPEDAEKLRAAWLAAEDKLDKSPDNEHFQKAHQKAWFAYMATKSDGGERLPPTLTTKKDDAGFYFLCVEHVEPKPEGPGS